jgi:hemoglobin
MNIHRRLHAKQGLTADNFNTWLALFTQSLEEGYEGPMASRARRVATAIAANMLHAVNPVDYPD